MVPSQSIKDISRHLSQSRERYLEFINGCRKEDGFSLTLGSEASPYALCFAIFGYHLLGMREMIDSNLESWDALLRSHLERSRTQHLSSGPLIFNKPYLQLLTFTLSSLAILGTLKVNPLEKNVSELIPNSVESLLYKMRVHEGFPRSGNQAMFLGILLVHARDYLNCSVDPQIQDWVNFHLRHMNTLGFWGNSSSMSHLQFQNGYHQYELLEYFEVQEVDWSRAAEHVATLSDSEGHFAPYPGGGGCYDYDAVFVLTGDSKSREKYRPILERTVRTIFSEQNDDGGFCESSKVRPLSFKNLTSMLSHIMASQGSARIERLKYFVSLIRPKNSRIHTHWSSYSRGWNESDLWDSWFRMLTIARAESFLSPERASQWGFIPYPGIGYHPSLKRKC